MKVPKYKLVMFDMDGTLMDSKMGLHNNLMDTMEHFGLEIPTPEMTKKLIGPKLYDTFRYTFCKSHDEATEMTEWFRKRYEEKYIFDASVYPGIEELLQKLKKTGIKIAIVTNKRYDYAEQIAEHFGISQYFDGIYGTDFENTMHKHMLIGKCLSDFGIDAIDSVLVGDTSTDEEAAEICNIDFIPVAYGFGVWDNDSASNNTADVYEHLFT